MSWAKRVSSLLFLLKKVSVVMIANVCFVGYTRYIHRVESRVYMVLGVKNTA